MTRLIVLVVLFAGSSAAGRVAAAQSHFALKSDRWVNLHHFLYHTARRVVLDTHRLPGRVALRDEDRRPRLSPADSARWRAALEVYAGYGQLDLVFDDRLAAIHQKLTEGPEAFPAGPGAEPAYAALRSVMPLYEAHWWPAHQAINAARIAELEGLLARYEAAFAPQLAAELRGRWPAGPIRVDVTVYANWAGAYTMQRPDRIVFAAAPDRHPGLLGLEILFHEASHAESMVTAVYEGSARAARAAGMEEGRLWHSLLFFVPGRIARSIFPGGYEPYAWANGLFRRGGMARDLPALEAEWRVDVPLDTVLARVHRRRAGS